jgi:phosphate uptake regulator
MGGLAEERVRESVRGLMERDHAALDSVLAGDEPINDLHMEVDDRCFKLLALHQPMAADLRVIVAAVKINTDLERVGDLASSASAASSATFTLGQTADRHSRMGELAQKMLRARRRVRAPRHRPAEAVLAFPTTRSTRSKARSSAAALPTCGSAGYIEPSLISS